MHDATDIRAQIEEERRIIEAASEGPWHVTDRGIGWEVSREPLEDKPDDPGFWPATVNDGLRETFSKTDATFIAHARAALPVRNAQIEAVLALHVLADFGECNECSNGTPWPCATVRAIEEAGK